MAFGKRHAAAARHTAELLDHSGPSRGLRWPLGYGSTEPLSVAGDAAVILLASILTGAIHHVREYGTAGDIVQHAGSGILVAALFVSLMKNCGMYGSNATAGLSGQIRTILLIWIAIFLLLAGAMFALKADADLLRDANISFAVIGVGALVARRMSWTNAIRSGLSSGRLRRKIVLITDCPPAAADNLTRTLDGLGFSVGWHLAVTSQEGSPSREEIVASTIRRVRGSDIEEIIVGTDMTRLSSIRELVMGLRVLPLPVKLIPLGPTAAIFSQPVEQIGNSVTIELQRGPLTPFECGTKRALDVAIALVSLIVLSIPLAVVALAIKLDSPGPIFFRQARCGFNGRRFDIYKFRTMSVQENGTTIAQATRRDPRVTRLGRILRMTSIDELPQLLNVLNGSMSIVGPRPHAIAHDQQFDQAVSNYASRHRMKPGLTGWAQVHGCRGPTPTSSDVQRRVEYDLWYIDNWSLRLDLTILLRTIVEVLRCRNAY
ncbi:undecaprenyl-phosphate glucose phosphotransferase [Bradyrhizobium genosp. L]|uniref:undecaprenyl-phosphate glucose phosphotransferase n=1 Tax=Bradyrhizobium genosp. L TaxID=83637 RepID=UPI0018A3004A|nr:undecaprenyl-phosphate glucose phosphotransferase [Bradyrhizobium genosp. L]QPF86531.1 undecaprenyl-phosphate glucose phosphotransferase [Bradyrhizobium genosp. L]